MTEVVVEQHPGSRIEYMMKAKSQFKRRSTATNVEISVPVPEDADSPKFKCNIGYVDYVPEKCAYVWKIKSFAGGNEYLQLKQKIQIKDHQFQLNLRFLTLLLVVSKLGI